MNAGFKRGAGRSRGYHENWSSEGGSAPSSRLGPASPADLEGTIRDYLEAPADDEGRVSNTYPPVFRAKPQESYQEWKRSVEFWIGGEGTQLPVELIGPRMMVQLKDRAAQLVKHLSISDVNGVNGVGEVASDQASGPAPGGRAPATADAVVACCRGVDVPIPLRGCKILIISSPALVLSQVCRPTSVAFRLRVQTALARIVAILKPCVVWRVSRC